ncbi:hypothetical protein HDU84_009274, partial [Entophlyctis sp. JEL0112]
MEGDLIHFDIEPIFEDESLNELVFCAINEGSNQSIAEDHHWQTTNALDKIEKFVNMDIKMLFVKSKKHFSSDKSKVLRITKLLDTIGNRSRRTACIRDASGLFREYNPSFEDNLDKQNNLIGFKNGVYDLDAMVFREGLPDNMITYSCGYNYEWDVNEKTRLEIKQLFCNIQPTDTERCYLQKFLGSVLHGSKGYELFHIFTGTTRNGKSLLSDILEVTFGEYYKTISTSLLTHERPSSNTPCPDLLALQCARVIVGSEPEKGKKINSGFMKYLTGNDSIIARALYSNTQISFKPSYRLVLL